MKSPANRTLIYLLLALFAFNTACKKEPAITDNDEEILSQTDYPEIIFQFEFINEGANNQHYGFFVAPAGRILHYENPSGWQHLQQETISATALKKNLDKSTEQSNRVDAAVWSDMESTAKKINGQRLEEPKTMLTDAGEEIYAVLILKKNSSVYERLILLNRGNHFRKNTGPHAKPLYDWLLTLNNGGIFKEQQ